MINKKLITYASRTKFNTDKTAGLIPNTSVVFIQDTGEIWTHEIFFGGNFSSVDLNYGTLLTKGHSFDLSLYGHKHAYTDLTGSTTTANQAIVSSGTTDGWTLATLGSNAFNSTAYFPLSGGTLLNGAFIDWQDSGSWGNSNATYPSINGGLRWSGTSDWIKLFAEETSADNFNLVLQFGDDDSPALLIRDNSGNNRASITNTGISTFSMIKKAGYDDTYTLLAGGGQLAYAPYLSASTLV